MAEGPYPIGRCNGMIIIWIRTIVRIVRANLSRETSCVCSPFLVMPRAMANYLCVQDLAKKDHA